MTLANGLGPAWPAGAAMGSAAGTGDVTRPTVRQQIDRSHAVRRRRARWLSGRGHGRPVSD
jgi:hypothetical protein